MLSSLSLLLLASAAPLAFLAVSRSPLSSPSFLSLLLPPLPDAFPPNPAAAFDGIYTRVLSPLGCLIIIICHVRTAPVRPSMVHLSFSPVPSSTSKRWSFDLFPPVHLESTIQPSTTPGGQHGFTLTAPTVGTLVSEPERDGGRTTHTLEFDDESSKRRKKLVLVTTERVPWTAGSRTGGPESWISRLGSALPLHWHVQSRGSKAEWSIVDVDASADEKYLSEDVREQRRKDGSEGTGIAHMEKNWGTTFPPSWIWLQAVSPTLLSAPQTPPTWSFTLAGGLLPPPIPSYPSLPFPPIEAYLLGLRVPSKDIAWDFRPPFSLVLRGWGLWMSVERNAGEGAVRVIVVDGWGARKVVVESRAETSTFIPLSCPLSTGHSLPSERFALESFSSSTRVMAYTRPGWWGAWEEVWNGETVEGALEFGGSWGKELSGKAS